MLKLINLYRSIALFGIMTLVIGFQPKGIRQLRWTLDIPPLAFAWRVVVTFSTSDTITNVPELIFSLTIDYIWIYIFIQVTNGFILTRHDILSNWYKFIFILNIFPLGMSDIIIITTLILSLIINYISSVPQCFSDLRGIESWFRIKCKVKVFIFLKKLFLNFKLCLLVMIIVNLFLLRYTIVFVNFHYEIL
jgi:hypothetical protein